MTSTIIYDREKDYSFRESKSMDLQKFLEQLPQQYQDWGSALMSPISEQLTLLSEKTASGNGGIGKQGNGEIGKF
jgi:hypothetical protein